MTDVSAFHTQRTSGPVTAQNQQGGLLAPTTGLGNFLDLLLTAVLSAEPQKTETTLETAGSDSSAPQTPTIETPETKFDQVLSLTQPTQNLTPSPLLSSALILPVQQPATEVPLKTDSLVPGLSEPTEDLSDGKIPDVIPAFNLSTAQVPSGHALSDNVLQAPSGVLAFASGTPDQNGTSAPGVPLEKMDEDKTGRPILPEESSFLPADTDNDTAPPAELAARLNALTVGGKQARAPETQTAFPQQTETDGALSSLLTGYQPTLDQGAAGYSPTPYKETTPITNHSSTQSPDLTNETDALPTIDLSALSSDRLTGLSTAVAQVSSNAVKHVDTAPKTLPLSSVALHLMQMAQSQETRSMTVQLNPPEMGRIQVKLNYGRDKTVKADIAVEKSETLSLLQKDSDTLRQALTDAGLQADAGALNFSLAHDGTFMGDRDGGGNASTTMPNYELGDDVAVFDIKTREIWTVDPKTGDVHYDILT